VKRRNDHLRPRLDSVFAVVEAKFYGPETGAPGDATWALSVTETRRHPRVRPGQSTTRRPAYNASDYGDAIRSARLVLPKWTASGARSHPRTRKQVSPSRTRYFLPPFRTASLAQLKHRLTASSTTTDDDEWFGGKHKTTRLENGIDRDCGRRLLAGQGARTAPTGPVYDSPTRKRKIIIDDIGDHDRCHRENTV